MKKVFINYLLRILMISNGFLIASCGAKFADLNKNSNGCTINIDENSWVKSSSPNVSVYPPNKKYYSVKAPVKNCSEIFKSNNNLTVSLNLKSTINKIGLGDSLVFLSIQTENLAKPTFVATNIVNNFATNGTLNNMIIDSSNNIDWKPPFIVSDNFILTFMIPDAAENQYAYYPKGSLYLEKK
jgi:hypothetical protein